MPGMTKAELAAELGRRGAQLAEARSTIRALGEEIRALKNRVSVEVQSGADWRGQATAYKDAFGHLAGRLAEADISRIVWDLARAGGTT